MPQQGLGRGPPLTNSHVPYSGFTVRKNEDGKDGVVKKDFQNGKAKAGAKANRAAGGVKADPFATPDNDYNDSFLDSLWINLLSSRMSAAVEAEAQTGNKNKKNGNSSGRVGKSGGGGGDSTGAARLAAAGRERSGRDSAGAAPTGLGSSAAAAPPPPSTSPVVAGGGMGGGYTYEDYVALATRLQAGAPERQRQVVRGVLRSLFPAWFPAFYRTLFPRSKVRRHTRTLA